MTTPFFPPNKSLTADPFDIFMARLVGRKMMAHSEGCFMVAYQYKGKTYITEMFTLESIKREPKHGKDQNQ